MVDLLIILLHTLGSPNITWIPMKNYLLLPLFICTAGLCPAQEDGHHTMKGSHRLTLGLGHTHTAEGEAEGKTEWLTLPSWSLNYDYWISNRWAVGLQSDLIMETFIIEHGDGVELERSNPLALVPIALFKPGTHWTFFGGVGVEIDEEKNLTMTRLGAEYGWHLPKNWEVGIEVLWDGKWNYYNSWGLAFTASKIFPKKHH